MQTGRAVGRTTEMSLNEEVERVEKYCLSRRNMAPRSAKVLSRCIPTFAGVYGITAPTTEGLKKLADETTRRGIKPATKRFYIAAFQLWAEATGRKLDVKAAIPVMPKLKKPLVRTIPKGDVETIIDACPDARDRALLSVGFYGGLRISEACKLTTEDVNLDEGIIYVRDPKNRKDRAVPIIPELRRRLEHYVPLRRDYLVDQKKNSDAFFITKMGTQIQPMTVRKMLFNLKRELGMDRLYFHLLRHTFASNALRSGIDVGILQEVCGWSSLDVATKYAHASLDECRSALDKFKY